MTDVMIPAWVDGLLTPVEKLDVHVKGLKHQAVSVFILCGHQVLLQQRAMGKYHTPGLWANTCCTHPHWSENPLDCAIRRLNEELGISGLLPQYRHRLEYRADVGNNLIEHEVVDVFLAPVPHKPILHPNAGEVMDTRWIDYRDLLEEIDQTPDIFTPWLKIYLRDHRSTIFEPELLQSRRA